MKHKQIKITLAQAIADRSDLLTRGDLFLTLETFDFSRDANGNTINKYRAALVSGDEKAVLNWYAAASEKPVLTSPYRREQSHQDGASAALYHLGQLGYELEYITTQYGPGKARAYRIFYRVKNAK
jgi:hypothetical protein